MNKTQLLASEYCTFLLAELNIFETWKGPSNQVIDATSFVTMWDTTIQKEAISYISSYQTLTADKNSKRYEEMMKLVKKVVAYMRPVVKLLMALKKVS